MEHDFSLSFFLLFFSWKSCTVAMPHVDLVKHVMELPYILLSLCMHKASLFHMTESALEDGVKAVPSQPSGISEVTPPEHHTICNQSGPWPPHL